MENIHRFLIFTILEDHMQKLVKRKMHYETIMPVEAYEEENNNNDDDWTEDLVSIGITFLGAVTGFVTRNPWVGAAVASVGIGHTVANNEEMMEGITAGIHAQTEAELQMADAALNAVSNAYNNGAQAITDAYIDWTSDLDIDYDDPLVQAYGE